MDKYFFRINDSMWIKSKVFRLSLILFLIQTILFVISKDILRYCLYIDIYTGILGIAVVITMTLIEVKMSNRYLKYLCWGHVYTSLFVWGNMQKVMSLNNYDIVNQVRMFNFLNTHMIYSISLFELAIIMVSIYCYKKRMNLIEMNSIYLLSAITVYTLIKFFLNNYLITANKSYIYEYLLIYIVVFIFTFYNVIKFSSYYRKKELDRLVIYITELFFLNIWMAVALEHSNIYILYFQYTFRLKIYLSVCVYCEREIIRCSNEQEYEKVEGVIKSNKDKNLELKNKEKLLIELEEKTKKSINKTLNIIDNICDGMMIFENDILIYFNDSASRLISDKIELKKDQYISLRKMISIIAGDNADGIEYIDNMLIYEDDKKEINLIKVENNVKVLVIKEIGYLLEHLKLEKEYSEFLKEEEVREEFYSNISHELRTPINIISSALKLNEEIISKKRFDLIKRNNAIIKQNCNRLIRTINNFIDSNKIEQGCTSMPRGDINLVYVIDDIVSVSCSYVNMKNSKLIFDPLEEEIYINSNAEQINRVFFNIISNALKYGEENKNIYITVSKKDKNAEIRIVYNSKEVPKEKITSMFERFSKLNYYLTRNAEGSGLGLYITKKIIERNGGDIELISNNGENTFIITLPLVIGDIKYENINELNLNHTKRQADIEFSDIYF